jgi:hypothetical protein
MAAKRYQLKLIGHGNLQRAGTHVIRITANATASSVEEQVKELFELPRDARIRVFEAGIDDVEESGQHPTLVSVSLQELVGGVLDFFKNEMEPSFLATSKPEVLVDTVRVPVVRSATATSSKGTTKEGGYLPKTWTPLLDKIWPFCIPRCVLSFQQACVSHRWDAGGTQCRAARKPSALVLLALQVWS